MPGRTSSRAKPSRGRSNELGREVRERLTQPGVQNAHTCLVGSEGRPVCDPRDGYATHRVDDETIVTEGYLRSIYFGADAAQRGFPVDDPTGFYLLTLRMLIVWPFDAEGFIIGEETYSAITTPDFFKKLEASEVPQMFRDYIDAR